jgi:site-specific DNA-methyltransferase (adenine-specific)
MGKRARSIVRKKQRRPIPNSIYLVKKKLSTSTVTLGCLHPELGLPALADKCIDHTITDPPFEPRTHDNRTRLKGKKVIHKEMGFDPIDPAQRAAVAAEIVRVTRGWALVFCEDTAIKEWQDDLIRAGASKRITCIWTKPNGAPNHYGTGPAQPCENIVTVWCGKGKSVWNGGGKMGRYDYPIDIHSRKREHTTEKPLALMLQLILDFTMPGQLVCDPYMGSGRTLIACKQLGREYIGWEIDRKSYKLAEERLAVTCEQPIMDQMVRHRVARKTAFGEAKRNKPKQLTL